MIRLRCLRTDLLSFVFLLLPPTFLAFPAFAQSDDAPAAGARITQVIDESSLVTLRGNTHPLARAKYDHGPAWDSMPANRLLLVLKRSAAQEAALETYLQAVQNSSQPSYHEWLTPDEFGRRFGVSDADLATIQSWLRSHGFQVSRVTSSRMAIEFSGTAGQVRSTFHTRIHRYVVNGEPHWANASDPQIPSALEPVIAGLAEMSDFVPRAQFVRAPSRVAGLADGRLQPNYTVGSATNGYEMYVGPADAATIYEIPNRYNAHLTGPAYDGSGVTIGIAGDSNIDVTQNAHYRATFGLPAKSLQVVVDGNDPGENGDAVEAYLDTEVSGGIAPNADVILYTAANTYVDAGLWLAILRALDDNQADILNVSFGNCEYHLGAAGNQFVNNLWQQAAAQGISVTVSTGDSGSAGCDDPNTEWEAKSGFGVNGIASTPNDIAVGGTDFDVLYSNFPSSFTSYVDVSNQFANHRSALDYIPEEPWNDSTYPGHNGTIAENMGWGGTPYYADQTIAAGGGGVSSCAILAQGYCNSGYPVPAWQSNVAVNPSGRNVPDVSFLAGNGLYGAAWGLCTDQDYNSSGNKIADCAGTPSTGNHFNLTGVGGTSAAAPTFAGILALLDQKAGGRLGQADSVIYALAKSNGSVFHSITTGNNSVFCKAGTSACALNSEGYTFMTGYNAGGSYNLAAGLGSVDAGMLIGSWSSVGFTPTTSRLTLNGGTAALHLTHGGKVNVDVSVTGSGGTPAGGVALVDNLSPATQPNSGSIGTLTLTGGTAKGTSDSLPGGSYKVMAHYGGNGAFAASDSNSIPVTVAPEESATALTVRGVYDPATGKLSSSPRYGYISVIDAQPYGKSASLANPNGPATGQVTFMDGDQPFATVPVASDGVAELLTTTLPAGENNLTAVYSGDPSFEPSTSGSASVRLPHAFTSIATPQTNIAEGFITAGAPVTFTTNLTNLDSDGAAPSGTVTFATQNTVLGTAPIKGTSGAPGVPATGSIAFTTTRIPAGNLEVTAQYNGDANYRASEPSKPVGFGVNPAESTLRVTPVSKLPINEPSQIVARVRGVPGLPTPTGTVNIVTQGTTTLNGNTPPTGKIVDGTATVTIPAYSLPVGRSILAAGYSGDDYYRGSSATIVVTAGATGTLSPEITITPASATIDSFPFSLTVNVDGAKGYSAPTGFVSLVAPGIAFGYTALTNGQVTFSIPVDRLPIGATSTLTAAYTGNSRYASVTATAQVTVADAKSYPNIEIIPAYTAIVTNQSLSVKVYVDISDATPNPTGTVTLSSGSYTSQPARLVNRAVTITIPPNSLAIGTANLVAKYSGDASFYSGSISTSVTVDPPGPAFNVSATNVSMEAGQTKNSTSAITITPVNGFHGDVALSATLQSSLPPNPQHLPTVSIEGSPVVLNGTAAGTATMVVTADPNTHGDFTYQIVATSPTTSRYTTVQVIVRPAPPSDSRRIPLQKPRPSSP